MASINVPCPWGEISFEASNDVDTLWYLKLRKFLETSSPIEWLSVDIMVFEHSFNLEEFRQNSPPPPREIQDLCLTVVMPESEYAAVIDGYFSVCHPKNLYLPTYHGHNERSNFYIWVYETLVNGDTYYCSCSNVKCWRHYLKDIKLESFRGKVAPPDSGAWKNEWRNLPEGTVRFALEWCLDVEND
ncbi:hypothetical protein CCACVL1_28074 [Corchorus capsularis]|uniref:Uncharacterized protein n=1 Tax=Corchorus capsularis TaxID=210143 RepID=A0A1R3G7N7_COCAP|nr:hypothetical protein CCACVL1_28074 [Corchorus capsularis]